MDEFGHVLEDTLEEGVGFSTAVVVEQAVQRYNTWCRAEHIPVRAASVKHVCEPERCTSWMQMDPSTRVYVCTVSRHVHLCSPTCSFIMLVSRGEGYRCRLTNAYYNDQVYSHYGMLQDQDTTLEQGEEEELAVPVTDLVVKPASALLGKRIRKKYTVTSGAIKQIVALTVKRLLCSSERDYWDQMLLRRYLPKKHRTILKMARQRRLAQHDDAAIWQLYAKEIQAGLPARPVRPRPVNVAHLVKAITAFWHILFPAMEIKEKAIVSFTAVCIQELATGTHESGIFPAIAWLAAAAPPNANMYYLFKIFPRSMTKMLQHISDRVQPMSTGQRVNAAYYFPLGA